MQHPDRQPELTRPVHDHLLHVLCSGDEAVYGFVLDCIAHQLQRPTSKPGVCIVFTGEQGVGKDISSSFSPTLLAKSTVSR